MKIHTTGRTFVRSTSFAAVAIAAWAGVTSSSALADASQAEIPQQTVSYADLNLNSTQGIAALYRRVHAAARQVCSYYDSRELALASRWRSCVTSASERAIAAANLPALTQYAQSREASPGVRIAMRASDLK